MSNPFYEGFVDELEKIAALPVLAKLGPKILPFIKSQVAPAAAQGAAMTAGAGLAQKLTAPKPPKPGA